MPDEKQITILQGKEAREGLDDKALIKLVNRVNELEVEDEVGEQRHAVAMNVFRLLAEQGLNDEGFIRSIDPAFPFIEHMKELRQRGDIAIAKDGEKTVGLVGFERLERADPVSGRNIYELRRMGVREEYEGQWISLGLYRAIVERIQNVDPNALLLVETHHPAVVLQCTRMGYEPYDLLKGLSIKYGETNAHQFLEWHQKNKTQFFLYDPSKAKASDTSAVGESGR